MVLPDPDKKKSDEWQKGLNLAMSLSGWLVGPLVLSLILGQYLDQKYQTKPWIFLILTGFAFLITALGLTIETMKYIRSLERDINKDKEINKDINEDRSHN